VCVQVYAVYLYLNDFCLFFVLSSHIRVNTNPSLLPSLPLSFLTLQEHDELIDRSKEHKRSSAALLETERLSLETVTSQLADLHKMHDLFAAKAEEEKNKLTQTVTSLEVSRQSSDAQVKRLQASLSEAYEELRGLASSSAELAEDLKASQARCEEQQKALQKDEATQVQYQSIVSKGTLAC